METKQLSIQLRNEADGLGLCDEWHNAWQDNSTQQELINKYLRGIDFCLQHHWPSNGFIKANFNKGLLRRNHIFVNDKRSVLNPKMAVVLGDSVVRVRINGGHASTIYLCDSSETEVILHSEEKIIIHTFDHARVNVTVGGNYKPDCIVLDHDKSTLVMAPESVRYKEDFDYLKD